jgi:DNA-binding NarL/FixJ family response regulator
MEDLRVVVVSDDPLAKTGLALLLADRDGIAVSGQVAADDDWHGPSDPGAPHVVVWDLGLGPRSGLPFLAAARRSCMRCGWGWWCCRSTI